MSVVQKRVSDAKIATFAGNNELRDALFSVPLECEVRKMPVKDGPSCPGCGLPNYEGLCPHCRGDQDAYERELVPPFESSR